MPAGATRFTDDSADCTNQFCVVGAIKNYTLQSQKLPMSQWPYDGDSSQPSPITFLIHFTGDCHQPLHVGWKSDLGGNTVHCTFFGRKSELHQVWDSGMIYHSGYNTTGLSALLLNWIAQNPSTVAKYAFLPTLIVCIFIQIFARNFFFFFLADLSTFEKLSQSRNFGVAFF